MDPGKQRPTTDELAFALKALRPLPDVAHRVLRIVQDPEYDVGELTGVVFSDPSLTARVLRLCNSAHSGLGAEIRSVHDAVSYLGMRNVVRLVLVTCSASLYAVERRTAWFDPAALWQHAIAFAVTCQVLAPLAGASTATAFTAGVLHDVGIMLLDHLTDGAKVAAATNRARGRGWSQPQFERACFGLDHAAANRFVAEQWRLPAWLAEALADHHGETAPVGAIGTLPAIVHTAEHIVAGIVPDPTWGPNCPAMAIADWARARLRLDDTTLETVRARASEETAALAELLNMQGSRSR